MFRQYLVLTSLLFGAVNTYPDPARSPKIYNALISSDENLQPSHAYPLAEPVLRTTALGVAFPPLIVPQIPQRIVDPHQPLDYGDNKAQSVDFADVFVAETPASVISAQAGPKINYYGSLYPLAYEPAHLPYANGLRLPVPQPVPYYPPYDQNAHLPPFYLNQLKLQETQHQHQQLGEMNIPQETLPELQNSAHRLPTTPEVPYYPVQPPLSLPGPGLGVNFQKNPDIPDVPPPPLPISTNSKQ